MTTDAVRDLYAWRDLQRITMAAFLAREGLRHEIMLPLPPDGVLDRRLLFFRRSGRDRTAAAATITDLDRPA